MKKENSKATSCRPLLADLVLPVASEHRPQLDLALQKAIKSKRRIPFEMESLFKGSFFYCLKYAKAINSRIPEFLEKSLLETDTEDRIVVQSIIAYSKITKLPTDLKNLFFSIIKKQMKSKNKEIRSWALNRLYTFSTQSEIPFDMEKMILKNAKLAFKYCILKNKRIPENEEEVFKKFELSDSIEYTLHFFKGRLPLNLENTLIGDVHKCQAYASEIVCGKLPEKLHNFMLLNFEDLKEKHSTKQYFKLIKKSHKYTMNVLSDFHGEMKIKEVLKLLGDNEYNIKSNMH